VGKDVQHVTDHDVAADLRWFYRDSEGAMGLHSNFSAMIAQLEGGGFHPVASYEANYSAVQAAARAREIGKALERCAVWVRVVLGLAFRRASGEQRLTCALVSAVQEHKRSKSRRQLPDWLEKQRTSKDQARKRAWAKLRAEALGLIKEASTEYIRAVEKVA
jgi:hypothetical protein